MAAADLLNSFAHSRYDVFVARPRSTHEFGKQSTLSGNNRSAVHDDLELSLPTPFEFDGSPQSLTDEGGETRCLCGCRTSGLAVYDPNVHSDASSPCRGHRLILRRSLLPCPDNGLWPTCGAQRRRRIALLGRPPTTRRIDRHVVSITWIANHERARAGVIVRVGRPLSGPFVHGFEQDLPLRSIWGHLHHRFHGARGRKVGGHPCVHSRSTVGEG